MFDLLTLDWFLPKALVGLLVGWFLRVLEDWSWRKHEGKPTGGKFLLWSILILTQSLAVGLPIAYLILLFIASSTLNRTALNVSAYFLPLLTGFVAVDVRDLLRRITRV
jgi:hypothetical protein